MEVTFLYGNGNPCTIKPSVDGKKVICFNLDQRKIAVFDSQYQLNISMRTTDNISVNPEDQGYMCESDNIRIYDYRTKTYSTREYEISVKKEPQYFVDYRNITWYCCSEVDGYILMEDYRGRVFDYLKAGTTLNHRYKITRRVEWGFYNSRLDCFRL